MSRHVFGRPEHRRKIAVVAFTAIMVVAVWSQRTTFTAAFGELRSLPWWIVGTLVIVGVIERVVRIDIFRGLFGGTSTFGTAATVHEVGTAVSKGIPMGGPIAMGMRWSICRDASIPTTTFTVTDHRRGCGGDVRHLDAAAARPRYRPHSTRRRRDRPRRAHRLLGRRLRFGGVLVGDARFRPRPPLVRASMPPAVRSRRAPHPGRAARGYDGLGRRGPHRAPSRRSAAVGTPRSNDDRPTVRCARAARRAARRRGRRRTRHVEFLRVFFIVTLLGSFIPTPGGVGVIEAGLSGALVASGVAPTSALAAVLVYRLITYVMPILFGAVLYLFWRGGAAARASVNVGDTRWAAGAPGRRPGGRRSLSRRRPRPVDGVPARSDLAPSPSLTSTGSWPSRRRRRSAPCIHCASRASPPSTRSST